ncbi:nuclear transport factor 2 family protein [Winogradskyella sp. R77965]|uniref:nuclear transport factor 2 family protein n=1 Tax=Winogradskyella sp. R77965 TaxID=3093872 RepID=UPI0037DCCCF4
MTQTIKTMVFSTILLVTINLTAQKEENLTENEQITQTINYYIEGTAYNYPEKLKMAFMPNANMFLDHNEKPLFVMTIEEYAEHVAKHSNTGDFNGRTTNILSIDRFGEIATAKLEVIVPSMEMRFIDFLLLKKLEDGWKIISKSAESEPTTEKGNKALLVLSNVAYQGNSNLAAGNSFLEVVIAYDEYQKANYHVDIISPLGDEVPLAYINPSDSLQLAYLYNPEFMYALKNTKRPNEINPNEYNIIQFTGGSAPIFDIPKNKEIQKIAMHIYEKNKGVIAAVCHGTAGIVNLKTSDGKYLVSNKNINGVPDSHETKKLPHYEHYPFIIEDVLKKRGGNFKHSKIRTPHMEVDGRLVTGQNSLSSKMVTIKSIEVNKKSN